jgi:hypothetical protein
MPRRKMRDLTAEELVVDLHPYNEWSVTHTREAVGQVYELVRYLNHATQHADALPHADAVGEVLQMLGQTVRRLPQVLKQAAVRAEALSESPAAAKEVLAVADLAERLDALGREIETAGFAARRF